MSYISYILYIDGRRWGETKPQHHKEGNREAVEGAERADAGAKLLCNQAGKVIRTLFFFFSFFFFFFGENSAKLGMVTRVMSFDRVIG